MTKPARHSLSNHGKGKSAHVTIPIPNQLLRSQVQEALEAKSPTLIEQVQYCDYGMRFSSGKSTVVVRQYSSGKLLIQGKPGDLFRDVLTTACDAYNSHASGSPISPETYLRSVESKTKGTEDTEAQRPLAEYASSDSAVDKTGSPPGYPYVGIDESGKGDYFGPLVIAAVRLDEHAQAELDGMGVRDSKQLSDKRVRELAIAIKEKYPDSYAVVEMPPARYNTLYTQFRAEKQNLNNLLAWGHARALENLLERTPCSYAISDKFGNTSYIKSKLMAKGASVELLQEPRAEKYTAVAAASVLARDRFLYRLKTLGDELGFKLPKGALPAVISTSKDIVAAKGEGALATVAKLHFKTTDTVLGRRPSKPK